MNLFSLSTAEQGASMALFQGASLVCESYWTGALSHSKRIMSMVEHMIVDQAGLTVADIDGFIAARGPGSFTGLRIGISVIKGLAAAVSKPCAGISSLDGIGYRFSMADVPVCVMMDARRNEVYTALYRFRQGGLVGKSEEMVCPPEQAIGRAMAWEAGRESEQADRRAGQDVLFVGSGSKAYREMIEALDWATISHGAMDYVCASALVRRALENSDLFDNTAHGLLPSYLRQSDAEIQLVQVVPKSGS